MSEWRLLSLGEVCELKRGYDLPAKQRHAGSVPIVSSSGISGFHDEVKVNGPGVVTGRYGTLGEVFFVEGGFWPLNTSLYVRDFRGNDPRFIALLLRSMNLSQYDGAAAVPGLNRNQLHTVPVRVPGLTNQRAISAVDACLGDLIENNRRRIELLESMARAIYREWFVHFRFPGHEDAPMVDSDLGPIPEGWTASKVGDVIELKYGKALKADARRGGDVAVVGSSGIVGWHDTKIVSGPALVLGRKGNVGSVVWVDGAAWPIDTTYYVETRLPLRFVAEQLRLIEFLNSHAAVPGLSREAAYRKAFLKPSDGVLSCYSKAVEPLAEEARNLSACCKSLASMRDVLLPRLVSGEIDVSGLDLDGVISKDAVIDNAEAVA